MTRQHFGARILVLLVSIICILCTAPAVLADDPSVSYQSHVQNIGWEDYVKDGAESGTTGQGLKLEAIKIKIENADGLGVKYRTHVQDYGWQDYKENDQVSGTEGENKRLEAIEISLTGEKADLYSIYYRVHAEDFGWLGWARDGKSAGTEGLSKRLEAIEIRVLSKTEKAPESEEPIPFIKKDIKSADELLESQSAADSGIQYRPYLNTTGWTEYGANGQEMGGADRIEAVQFDLSPTNYQYGGIVYKTYSEDSGWSPWVQNNDVSGHAGAGLQAVRIKLTGKLPYLYDIFYRVHVPGVGWSGFARMGEAAGSEGLGQNINIVQVMLTEKGAQPGPTEGAFRQGSWVWPVPSSHTISDYFGPRDGSHHDGMDIAAYEGAPIVSCKSGIVMWAGPQGNFGNLVAVEHDAGECVYYGHMSSVATTPGTHVNAGDVIGYVGNTGHSFGNHLHIEVFTDGGILVDPLTYLR